MRRAMLVCGSTLTFFGASLTAPPVATATEACTTTTPSLNVLYDCSTPGVTKMAIPAGATSAYVVVIGGGGGGSPRSEGGAGAQVSTFIGLTASMTHLLITVAGGGKVADFTPAGANAGGSSGGGTPGQYGSFGPGGSGGCHGCNPGVYAGATGGGMSAVSDGTGKTSSSPMFLADIFIIAGGGGGAGDGTVDNATEGGAGAFNGDGSGGDGLVATGGLLTNPVPARGGRNGTGGAGGSGTYNNAGLTSGGNGDAFNGTDWGAGGATPSGGFGASGGAGYGGGGGAPDSTLFGGGAGGSRARGLLAADTLVTFTPAATAEPEVARRPTAKTEACRSPSSPPRQSVRSRHPT